MKAAPRVIEEDCPTELWGRVITIPGAPSCLFVFQDADGRPFDLRPYIALAKRVGELLAPHLDELFTLAEDAK